MPAAKLRASFDRVSVLLDSVEPIEWPLLARSGRLANSRCLPSAISENQGLALLSWAVSATEASVVSRRKVNVS